MTGTKLPAQRRIEVNGDRARGWMSPDEYLLVLPYADVALAWSRPTWTESTTAVDVSDARAVFRVEGHRAAEVLQKLSPVDLDTEPGELPQSNRPGRGCDVATGSGVHPGLFPFGCQICFLIFLQMRRTEAVSKS